MDRAQPPTTQTDNGERPHLDCVHCRYARGILDAYTRNVGPLESRGRLSLPWGGDSLFCPNPPLVRGLDTCRCDCHDIWRMFTSTKVAS